MTVWSTEHPVHWHGPRPHLTARRWAQLRDALILLLCALLAASLLGPLHRARSRGLAAPLASALRLACGVDRPRPAPSPPSLELPHDHRLP